MSLLRNLTDLLTLNRRLYHWSDERIRQWQSENVLKLVSKVRQESPFYKDLYRDRTIASLADFSCLPVIGKSIMMAHFDQLNTAGLHLDDVMAFALRKELAKDYLGYYQDRYVVGLSSGTSGNKGIYVTPRSLTERLPGVFLARGGVRLTDLPLRILFILRVFSQGFADINAPLITLNYRSSMTEPASLIETMNKMRANILMAPPSLLRQLMPLCSQIRRPPRRIISYAEVLDPLEKERFAKAFRAPVVEIYQTSEGQIASPCRCGSLHINEDLVYVELLDEQGAPLPSRAGLRSSRMLVTNLVNPIQPLLRYEMNDMVELGDPCPCGSHFRVLGRVIGRNDDVLYLRDRIGQNRAVYPDLVSRWIITTDDRIREFLVEQDASDHLTITVDLPDSGEAGRMRHLQEPDRDPVFDEVAGRLSARLRKELAEFAIDCRITVLARPIPLPADNRKMKRFVSRIPSFSQTDL